MEEVDELSMADLFRRVGFGAPRIYDNVEDFAENAVTYFERCGERCQPPTLAGLALWMGFSDRSHMHQYANDNGDFLHAFNACKSVIANWHEVRVGQSDKPTGSIFMLKNLGYTDSQTIEHKGDVPTAVFKIGKTEISF